MATETRLAPSRRAWGETMSLTTAAAYTPVPPGAHSVTLYCASAFRYQFCPPLRAAFVYDLSGTSYTAVRTQLADKNPATVATLNDFAGHADHDYLYLGSDEPFAGVYVDVGNTNSNASVMSGYYYNGTTWADASITDGTDSGGATLAQDGAITLTPAAAWAKTSINGQSLYWLRLEVTATLDASVTIRDAVLIDDGSWVDGYAEASTAYEFGVSAGECSGLMAVLGGGSATLNVTWLK